MPDNVKLVVGGSVITGYNSYSIDSNMLTPADEFSLAIPGAHPEIAAGQPFKFYANDTLEFTGIVEKREPRTGPQGGETTLSGRDLMGLLADSSLEKEHCNTLNKLPLKEMARKILAKMPLLKDHKTVFMHELADSGVSGRKNIYKGKKSGEEIFAETGEDEQYARGTSMLEALADKAQRHGLLFWMDAAGQLVFGRPQGPDADAIFNLRQHTVPVPSLTDLPRFNNVLNATLVENIEKTYSQVTIVGQAPGGGMEDMYVPGNYDFEATARLKNFPFYKPLTLTRQCRTAKEATYLAKIELYKRLAASWRVSATVAGHRQGGTNFCVNAPVNLKLDPLAVQGKFLILGRRFLFSRDSGQTTALEIGKMMEGYVSA